MTIFASIEDPAVIGKIQAHLEQAAPVREGGGQGGLRPVGRAMAVTKKKEASGSRWQRAGSGLQAAPAIPQGRWR